MNKAWCMVVGLAAVVTLVLAPTVVEATPSCGFSLGFAAYHAAHSAIVGNCRDSEAHDANGDGWQHTDNGYLVWRKATNIVTFYADLSYLAPTTESSHSMLDSGSVLHRCRIEHPDPAWPCTLG